MTERDSADTANGSELRASIVITNYNYADHVGAAIASAVGQHGGGVEVIVVDDGSTDGSVDLIERIIASMRTSSGELVRLIAQPNGGQGSAFNTGFAASSADIVVFLDADDTLAPDLVDNIVDTFRNGVARVQFPLRIIDANGDVTGGSVPDAGVDLASGDVRRQLTSFPDDIAWQPTSGNAFRRVLDRILPMPTDDYRICADYYLSNLTPIHGSVAVLERPGGSYRVHDDNSHFTTVWSLEAIRANIVRTSITHRHLIAACDEAGLDGLPTDPDAVRSVTALAHRMVSLRLEPDVHPIDGDTRWSLAVAGIRAAAGRFDTSIRRRITYAGWFVAAAIVPRSWVPRVAAPFISVAV